VRIDETMKNYTDVSSYRTCEAFSLYSERYFPLEHHCEQKKKFNIQNDKVSIDWVSCMTNFHGIYHHRIQHKTTFCCSTQIHLLNNFLFLLNLFKLPSSLLEIVLEVRENKKTFIVKFFDVILKLSVTVLLYNGFKQ